MAGFSPSTWVLDNAKMKSIATGVKGISAKPDGTGLIFTLNDNSTVTLDIPNHTHTNLKTILEKFSLDANDNLLFDNIRLLTEKDFIITSKYSDLTTPTKESIAYILKDETISNILYKKGFYVYNNSKWEYVGSSDFNLNAWKPNTKYQKDEYVYINYKLYKSLSIHTSSTNFTTDLKSSQWELIIGGAGEEIDSWESGKTYSIGDKVTENNCIYQCIQSHTSNIFLDEINNWVQVNKEYVYCTIDQYQYLEANNLIEDKLYVVDGINDTPTNNKEWKTNTRYNIYDQIIYQNVEYECIIAHTSTTLFDDNRDSFIKLIDGHYYCYKTQYDYMNINNLLKEKIYIVDGI